ncbi:hypothetical protein TraAM80_03261 [Trypanosoma rangeli]|uniref:Uncharacterized protein n=1 Tax=Trypanosoma rangeli TaxID=5698 RepID=A0A422NQ17_TRYRA|nr:uncharacterized protein TraAM80_03261 [Trypanosoma rangeli]RNF07578.1 hypothetical protein TraAM80_03261 [Trypanosoma rangeli]|eukprot:RNF07578.1 hypothetical protein TraAM80_03261 [Trypanosoma rangeli]
MYGKRVSPDDYSLYVPQRPLTAAEYKVRNRTEPYIILQSTESSPLYSSFVRNGYNAHAHLRWVRGKNDFDRQLNSARHHLCVLQRIEQMNQAREYYGRHVRTGFLRSPSVDFSSLATTLTSTRSATTPLSSPSRCRVTERQTRSAEPSHRFWRSALISSAAGGSRRPESSSSAESAPHNAGCPRLASASLPLPPLVRVCHTCLVARGEAEDPAVEQLVKAASGFTSRCPPRRKSNANNTLSRRSDERLMRLLRGSVTVY